MRDEDRIRILHMIDAAEAVAQFIAGRSRDDLDRNRMLLFRWCTRVRTCPFQVSHCVAKTVPGHTAAAGL